MTRINYAVILDTEANLHCKSGARFSKNLIHVARKISHFTLHISLIQKCTLSLHISHILFQVSHIKFLIYMHILHFTPHIL